MSNTNQQSNSVRVRFATIAWIERNNGREEYGSEEEQGSIRNSLMKYGWLDQNPVPAIREGDGALTETQIMEEMNRRQLLWDSQKEKLKSHDSPANIADLRVFEILYTELTDPKDEESPRRLITPVWSANAGFRRGRNYYAAMCLRFQEKAKPGEIVENDVREWIPIMPKVYRNPQDRIIEQQLENEIQTVGVKRITDKEKLNITKKLFDAGCKESDVRKLYSSSIGQKMFGICLADMFWPKLKVYDRVKIFTPDHPDFVPLSRLRAPDLIKLNNRREANRKRKEGLSLSKDERALEPWKDSEDGSAEFDKYLRDEAAKERGSDGKLKPMKKEDMEAAIKNHPLLFVRSSLEKVKDAGTDIHLSKLIEHKDVCNDVFATVKEGNPEKVKTLETVVSSLKDDVNAQILQDVSELLSLGKAEELKAAIEAIKNPPPPPPSPIEETPSKDEAKVEHGGKHRTREKQKA